MTFSFDGRGKSPERRRRTCYRFPVSRIAFLLSPARADGRRAQMLLNSDSAMPLARRLREPAGAPLGEVYSFMSSLYFRGKLAYVRAFAAADPGAHVIVPGRGLLSPDEPIRRKDLLAQAKVTVSEAESRFRAPLERDARRLAASLRKDDVVVLLGSIATDKYVEVLGQCFGERLLFPSAFIGRGDMSRGGLMMRCAREGRPLEYVPVSGAVRRGPRPPKLEPLRA
jgi:hypothetical protein